jgi:hypothetical protein
MKCAFCGIEGKYPCKDSGEASFCGIKVNRDNIDGSQVKETFPVKEDTEEDIFHITASGWTDHDDGSASVTLDMSKNTVQFFAQHGLLHALASIAKTEIEKSNS